MKIAGLHDGKRRRESAFLLNMEMMMMVTVYPTQKTFTTITEALVSVDLNDSQQQTFVISAGVYKERLMIRGQHIRLIGVGAVSIEAAAHATQIGADGHPIETFQTATVYAEGTDIQFENLQIVNRAGFGPQVGQAVAFYGNGDGIIVDHCAIRGNQDTVFLAPLPATTAKGLPFNAPVNQHAQLARHRYRFTDCLITGNVDYIFGGGSALFRYCEIRTISGRENGAFIAAPSTLATTPVGLVFWTCRLTREDIGVVDVALARPWRPEGKAWYLNCSVGPHILTTGWDNWNGDRKREKTTDFREEGSHPFTPGRVTWATTTTVVDSRLLTEIEQYFDNPC